MSTLREKRWNLLLPLFKQLQVFSEDCSAVISYDGDDMRGAEVGIDSMNMTAWFQVKNCKYMFYNDYEQEARTSASTIIKDLRASIKVYRLEHIW